MISKRFNAENRLTSVLPDPDPDSVATSFKYDADGNLVGKLVGSVATYYIGGVYEVEVTNTTPTKKTYYYPAGGAIRVEDLVASTNNVYYILKDHLGSASVTLNSSGASIAESRFYPFGETRVSSGTIPTDKRFQSQRDVGLGLMHFGARFYHPYLNRMIQPDSIVPDYTNPQSLNRYAFVLNNPLKYVDPTGHSSACGSANSDPECPAPAPTPTPPCNSSMCALYQSPTPTCNSSYCGPQPTQVIVFGGSYPTNINIPGPEVEAQMSVWVTDQNEDPIPDSNLIQYPGVIGDINGKWQQAKNAQSLGQNASVRLIFYSAGTEACLLYAQWRIEQGLGVEDVVLLGPTFQGANTAYGDSIDFGASGGDLNNWASYMDNLLTNGTDVLVIDDGSNPFDVNPASEYSAPANATGTFDYVLRWGEHYDSGLLNTGTNADTSTKLWVYYWMLEATP